MDLEDFTPRNLAKDVVKTVVTLKATALAKDIITDYTRFEEDNIVVKISTGLIGGYVGARVKPITDKMVDKTADFIVAKREEQKSKKTQKETEDEQ